MKKKWMWIQNSIYLLKKDRIGRRIALMLSLLSLYSFFITLTETAFSDWGIKANSETIYPNAF